MNIASQFTSAGFAGWEFRSATLRRLLPDGNFVPQRFAARCGIRNWLHCAFSCSRGGDEADPNAKEPTRQTMKRGSERGASLGPNQRGLSMRSNARRSIRQELLSRSPKVLQEKSVFP